MVNFSAFEVAHKKYGMNEAPFLTKQREKLAAHKPYQGLKILHNIPLTLEAVLKMEPLLLGGAEVTASCITALPPNQDAINILKAANVPVQIDHNFNSEYDLALDCCGELVDVIVPKRGAVELTQTGSEIYKKANCQYPVISVDDSELKYLETLFGTGEGFVQAIKFLVNKELYNRKFILFGCGKVGIGIMNSLLKFTENIAVIETSEVQKALLGRKGVKCIDGADIQRIRTEMKNAFCAVTATGERGVISNFYNFTREDFGNALLANMGADDEFGMNFSEDDVLFNKKTINFAIPEPTTMKYLDPILYAHNVSIDAILSEKMSPGYHSLPEDIVKNILSDWAGYHNEVNAVEIKKYFA